MLTSSLIAHRCELTKSIHHTIPLHLITFLSFFTPQLQLQASLTRNRSSIIMQSHRDLQFQRGRNRGRDRGRGRGRGRGGTFQSASRSTVPNINQVVPGGFVSIVLKVDQGTDREVQGVVQDLLTRGDHPRGIKVRLRDGRVGRVQRMVSEATAMAGQEGLSGLGENGENYGSESTVGERRRRGGGAGERGVEEQEQEGRRGGYSLEDFLPVGHPLRNDSLREDDDDDEALEATRQPSEKGEVHMCPVCGDFEGDEAAVSHHVNAHFDDS